MKDKTLHFIKMTCTVFLVLLWSAAGLTRGMAQGSAGYEETLLYDDYEEYTVDNHIAAEALAAGHSWWSTWSNAPGGSEDGYIAEIGGTKCGRINYGNDQILHLGDQDEGVYDLEFDLLVPEGKNGYFSILHRFASSNSTWAMQCYLHLTQEGYSTTLTPGHGTVHAGSSNTCDLPCVFDEWMHFRIHVDIDLDIAQLYFNEQLMCEWQWSLDSFGDEVVGGGLNAMNFYPPWNASTSEYYIDNFSLKRVAGDTTPRLITAISYPEAGGTIAGAGEYVPGTQCVLTSIPNEGFVFENWTENGEVVSTEAVYSFVVKKSRDLVANFIQVSEGNLLFADETVKSICVSNWDTNGDGELSYAEAAVVTDLGDAFSSNGDITSFDELQYFIKLTSLGSTFATFSGCENLTSIVIPKNVTSIHSFAFYYCPRLEQIVVEPGNLVYDSRENCNAIIETASNRLVFGCRTTIIPNTVTSIGYYAFNYSGFSSIIIPNSVTTIETCGFYHCDNITSITIPYSVTNIRNQAFSSCSGLETLSVDAGNAFYDSREDCNAIIETSSNNMIAGCKNTVVPNTVTSIGAYAFDGSAIASIDFPNSLTNIGYCAFYYCRNLSSIVIPNSVEYIDYYAFMACYGLQSLTLLSETPPSLGEMVFYGANTDIPVYVPCGAEDAYNGWGGFSNIVGMCPGEITAIVFPEGAGTVVGTGEFDFGEDCTLIATANENYLFMNWTVNGEVVSTEADYSFMVAGDKDLVANFIYLGSGGYIDLGFPSGTLWANCNIGANAPEEYGDYFAWGETQPKTEYTLETYSFFDSNEGHYTKYTGEDGLTALLPEDDAATANWGNDWMMPTTDQWQELLDNTYYESTTRNGVNGLLFTSYWNGNSLFLPFAGIYSEWYEYDENWNYQEHNGLHSVGDYSFFWSVMYPGCVLVASGSDIWVDCYYSRYYGCSVRPVRYAPFTVDANSTGGGTVSGEGVYERGETCVLTAIPDAGYMFLYWTENGNVVSYEATYSFVVTNSRNLVANFAMPIITATADPEEGGTVSGAGVYYYGSECTLTATPIGNYAFVNWTENGVEVSTEATYCFTVTGDRDLVAHFQTIVISVTANPLEGGVIAGAGTYLSGMECTLTATADDGFLFMNWTENGMVVSADPTYTFTVTGDRNLVANFSYADVNHPDGVLTGHFSIDPHHQIHFSMGNLQYIGGAGNGEENNTGAYWKFADHQWDYFGDNGQCSDSHVANRDLFGWGTSGNDHGAVCYQPWSTSRSNSDYAAYGCDTCNLYDYTGQADWGYNAISNGGNTENSGWRTLTIAEWNYLLNTRHTLSGMRYVCALVNGVSGAILLPDDWDPSYYTLNNPNGINWDTYYDSNVITATQWKYLEQHGAAFLPAAGYRRGTSIYNLSYSGSYWTSSINGALSVYGESISCGQNARVSDGLSVRLACPALSYSFGIGVTSNPMEGGSVIGSGAYELDAECTLVATANEGYTFVNWTDNGEEVSTEATYTFSVTEGRNLVANFRYAEANYTDGALIGQFSINADGQQICFSQGNLQYIGSTGNGDENNTGGYWKFAEHQWDVFGDNGQISDIPTANRDLFGWGTSGYNHSTACYRPWESPSNYYAYGNETNHLYDFTGKADWGYNAISNGGNAENSGWRTLTYQEWGYLLEGRETESGLRYVDAWVNGVNGIILLPDDWDTNYYTLNPNGNVIDAAQWNILEQHGAVFLPRAGIYYKHYGWYNPQYSAYWSSSAMNYEEGDGAFVYNPYDYVWYLDTGYDGTYLYYTSQRSDGFSVRLVRPAQNTDYSIDAAPVIAEYGVVEGSGTYFGGTRATLTALANEGYAFVNWTENGEVVSTDLVYSFTVSGDRSLVANFSAAGTAPDGALQGRFTVGDGQHVYFSQGNLQYIGSAGNGDENNTGAYWKFADHQWDFFGSDNQTGDFPIVDRDLFAWGTSGHYHGTVCYQPWSASNNNEDYHSANFDCDTCSVFDQEDMAEADWGYNAIVNGGNQENSGWHTMQWWEWDYLLRSRSTLSGIRYAKAKVNDVDGLILLPDDWDASYYTLQNTNYPYAAYNSNILTGTQWITLEQHGAVFLPAAFSNYSGTTGLYWTASSLWDGNLDVMFSKNGLSVGFYSYGGNQGWQAHGACYRESVRLVRTINTYTVNAVPAPVEHGNVEGSGLYFEGAPCTLTAIPNEGYAFYNWTEDGTVVSTENPYSFTVTGDKELVANFVPVQSTVIPEGWTWYSTYLDGDGSNMLRMMEESLGEHGLLIKSHTEGFVSYDEYGWIGTLNALRPESMYMINTDAPVVVNVAGPLADAEDHPITLNPGWTWIGYPSILSTDLNEALATYDAHDGDVIKMHEAFSQYVEGVGWMGSVETLMPGEGLMYHSLNSDVTTFAYSVGEKSTTLERNLTGKDNHWVPDAQDYPYNMSVVAVVELDGIELGDSRYELAAFTAEECRGSIRLKHVAPIDRYLAFLTVLGNSATDLRWALYDTETGMEYRDCEIGLHFEQNAILGTVKEPVVVRFGDLTGTDDYLNKVSCYPNPVGRSQYVRLDIPALLRSEVQVKIVNALGAVVSSQQVHGPTAEVKAPVAAGVYAMWIVIDGKNVACAKLIVE